jgi:transposase
LTPDLGPVESGHCRGSEMIHDHGPQDVLAGVPAGGRRPVPVHAGATLRGIAGDLGISRHTLQVWVQALDPDATPTTPTAGSSGSGSSGARRRPGPAGAELTALQARIVALETENAQLLTEQAKLSTEWDILRQAAKYFAGETRW